MELVKMFVSLLGVLGLMFLTFFGLKRLNRRISTTGGRLKIIDRANLGRDSMLLVVSVCGNLMLVGVSAQRMEKLSDLDMTEEQYLQSVSSEPPVGVFAFSDILNNFMGKNRHISNSGGKNGERNEKEKNENENS